MADENTAGSHSNTTLADKNNNIGNLKYSGSTTSKVGQGPNQSNVGQWKGSTGENAGFETFDTAESGVRASVLNLYTSQEKHGNNSVRDIVTRWAPPDDPMNNYHEGNETEKYIANVAAELGVDPDDDLGSLRDNPALTHSLIKAIGKQEGATVGKWGKFTNEVITDGVAMANGKVIAPKVVKNLDAIDRHMTENLGTEAGDAAAASALFYRTRIETGKVENLVSPNWLSTVDSPAYRWTLYIVDNEIWNDPNMLAIDDAALNTEKAKIIAKQGITTEFTIDNFAIMSVVTPGARHGNTTPGIIQFDLFETFGFTFLDKCLNAGISIGKPSNLHSQNYILKLEFLGRDFVTGRSTLFPSVFFYPIRMNQIRSSTGPEGTRYNIIGWSSIKHAQTETVTETDLTIKNVVTVGDFAKGLETVYNKGIKEAMNPSDFGKAQLPPKQIKVVFDTLSDVRSAPNTITSKLKSFSLEHKKWGHAADGAETAAEGANPHDISQRDVTIERESNMAMTIATLIQKNCPEWTTWTEEAVAQGITPYIVVTPDIKYRALTKGSMEHKYANVEPSLITLTIKIGLTTATAPLSIKEHTEKLANKTFQNDKIRKMAIDKAYTFMYSGTNTEVLNYGIDIEQLYVVTDYPSAGMYMHGKGSEGEPQFGTSEIPLSVTAEKSPYLEDIPYTGKQIFNDLIHGGLATAGSAEEAQRNENSISKKSVFSNKLSEYAKREIDALEMNIEIKGDPFWMSTMSATVAGGKFQVADYNKRDALISFVQWNPNVDKLLTEQTKGQIDIVSSGIYKITSIDSRFAGGKFTQTLHAYKDPTTNTLLVLSRLIELSGDA